MEPSNYDEIFMQRSLIFAESLRDLKNVRSQLYSAAEFFEDSYHKTDHDPLLLESLKDYVSQALINTIDHLGSVTSKVNSFLDENVDEAFETNLRVLCIKQRLQTCQTFSDHEGLSQQSLVIQIPKYHKQYLLPGRRFSEAVEAEKAEQLGLRRVRNERDKREFGSDFVDFSFAKAGSNKRSGGIVGTTKRFLSFYFFVGNNLTFKLLSTDYCSPDNQKNDHGHFHQVGSESSVPGQLLVHRSVQSLRSGIQALLFIDQSLQIHIIIGQRRGGLILCVQRKKEEKILKFTPKKP